MTLDLWRNISVIWLGLQLLVLCLIPVAIAFFAVRGMGWVLRKTPVGFERAQSLSKQMKGKTEAVSDRVAAPVIQAQVTGTRVKTIIESLGNQREK